MHQIIKFNFYYFGEKIMINISHTSYVSVAPLVIGGTLETTATVSER